MIRELRLCNFLGFEGDIAVPLAPITVVCGPNSSGKSALLHALAVLRQSMPDTALESNLGRPLLFRGPLIDVGDFRNAVNRHDLGKTMTIGLTHDILPLDDQTIAPNQEGKPLAFDVSVRWSNGQAAFRSLRYSIPEDRSLDVLFVPERGLGTASESGRPARLVVSRGDVSGVAVAKNMALESTRQAQSISHHRTGGSRQHAPASAAYRALTPRAVLAAIRKIPLDVQGFLPVGISSSADAMGLVAGLFGGSPTGTEEAVWANVPAQLLASSWNMRVRERYGQTRWALERLHYLGPLRAAPKRFEMQSGRLSTHVGVEGQQTASLLWAHSDLQASVNRWLKQMEVPYSVAVEQVRAGGALPGDLLTLTLTDLRTNTRVSGLDVGFGLSQVLPVITQIAGQRRGITCVEQPEIHLHPRLQAHLADLFIESVGPGLSNQIVAETHSEALLLRLQRRIREGLLLPSQLSVVYVGASPNRGSWVRSIPLNERGDFMEEWPDGFFEERFDEWQQQ